jgi:hypothetical protein
MNNAACSMETADRMIFLFLHASTAAGILEPPG